MINITQTIEEHRRMIDTLDPMVEQIRQVAGKMSVSIKSGGKILWMGNGGSAADAQHLAAELVGRFTREREALASIALTTDTSILTALANDYDFDMVFARQVEALCRPEDVVVGITTSGNSPNVLAALKAASKIGAYTVGMTGGSGGKLPESADACLVVSSPVTARIQEGHILIGHILCDWIEAAAAEGNQDV